MDTGDRSDKAFIPGQKISLIRAVANVSVSGVKHNVAIGEGILTLVVGEEQKTAISTTLTVGEENGLSFIREEEKAALDLYKYFYRDAPISIYRLLLGPDRIARNTSWFIWINKA